VPYNSTMRNPNFNKCAIEIIAALLIFLFVYTGVSKLNEQNSFRAVLSRSPLIGSTANLLSWLLPILELITAALLLIPFFRKAGLVVSLGLMTIFTGYIAYMIIFTPHLPCSCGGVLKQMTWKQHLWFNVFFTGLSAAAYWLYQHNKLFVATNRNSRTPV
jgi:putative oxidoreductase